jgi:hypothetical protein
MSRLPLVLRNCLRRCRGAAIDATAVAAAAFSPNAAQAVVTLSGGGLVLAEQGGIFAANNVAGASFGAVPFSSSDLGPQIGIPFHVAANLNDEIYGNSNSWIGGDANPFPAPFAGVSLDGAFTLSSIAFGRDNLGGFPNDRWQGVYTLQYTTAAGVGSNTPDASWTTIGTLNYGPAGGANYSIPSARHRYNFDPVSNVTGIRMLVPSTGVGNNGTAIDEIELYETPAFIPPPPPPFTITPAVGHSIGWDGNDGDHFDPAPPPAGALVPNNLALASNGAIPFASSQLDAFGHLTVELNDGIYGNANAWIGGDPPILYSAPFAGVALDGLFYVSQIAFGRDNGNGAFDDSAPGTDCCGGQADDRWQGIYTLQYTQVPNADKDTPDTGDPTTGWASIGALNLTDSSDLSPGGGFTAYLRHAFDVSADGAPILASGIRIIVPSTGLGNNGTAIDEIEVYGSAVPEPSTYAMLAMGIGGVAMLRRRRK